jgi:hypothetical protein
MGAAANTKKREKKTPLNKVSQSGNFLSMRSLALLFLCIFLLATHAMDVVVDILKAAPGNAQVTTKHACSLPAPHTQPQALSAESRDA